MSYQDDYNNRHFSDYGYSQERHFDQNNLTIVTRMSSLDVCLRPVSSGIMNCSKQL